MKKIILVTISIILLISILTSCGTVTNSSTTTIPTILPGEPPIDKTWISPGKVNISNFHADATAEYFISIHNGNSVPTVFLVTYRVPGHVNQPYLTAPESATSWVTIDNETPIIPPFTTKDIPITLTMPKGAIAPDKWEFWISVIEQQSGNIQTELCSRWLITMRD